MARGDEALARVEFGALAKDEVSSDELIAALRVLSEPSAQQAAKQRTAARWLAERGETTAIPHLERLLGSSHPHCRCVAVQSLGALDAQGAADRLRQVAREDEAPWVRSWAVAALADLGDPSVGKELLPYLEDQDVRVRASAAVALGKLGDPSALAALRAAGARDRWRRTYPLVRKAYRQAIRQLSR